MFDYYWSVKCVLHIYLVNKHFRYYYLLNMNQSVLNSDLNNTDDKEVSKIFHLQNNSLVSNILDPIIQFCNLFR